MSDLVKHLRWAGQDGREIIERWQMDPNLFDEAADRIEQLEAALRDVIKDFNNEERPLIWQSIATARAALDPHRMKTEARPPLGTVGEPRDDQLEAAEGAVCECPKCGRMHRDLGFGKPPSGRPISVAELEAILAEPDRPVEVLIDGTVRPLASPPVGTVGEARDDQPSNTADYGNSPREIQRRALSVLAPEQDK
jgi:hypothetical protein